MKTKDKKAVKVGGIVWSVAPGEDAPWRARLAEYNVPWPDGELAIGLVDRSLHERTIVDVSRLILKSRVRVPGPLRIYWAASAAPTK